MAIKTNEGMKLIHNCEKKLMQSSLLSLLLSNIICIWWIAMHVCHLFHRIANWIICLLSSCTSWRLYCDIVL